VRLSSLGRTIDKNLSDSNKTKNQVLPHDPMARDRFIEQCYQLGGKPFVEAVKLWGVNERGDRLTIYPWHEEYAELIGDFRVKITLASGCAQVGKTLLHTLLVCFCLTEGRLNTLWSYDQERTLDLQVPSNFRPVIRQWLASRDIKVGRSSEGVRNNSLYQLGSVSAQFTYVSTSAKTKNEGGAAAGGIAVGTSRDILLREERSQYPLGAGDPLVRRLDASRLPSQPIRDLGTPGSGNGIELEIETADHYFYPHCTCENCSSVIALDPKGCLLKPIKRTNAIGEDKISFLSETGRPVEWHHESNTDAVNTAMFACVHCGYAIASEKRRLSHFRCLKTGKTLRQFLDDLPVGIPKRRWKIGINLSPLLRITEYNLAAEIIREGIDTHNSRDWQQQRLGHPSESEQGNITLEMLRNAIAAPRPTIKPDIITAGVDQGRGEDWLVITGFFYPPLYKRLSISEIMEKSTRIVLFGGDVQRSAIPEKLREYGVTYGIIDNEPDRADASELCRVTCLEMADQKPGLKDAVKQTTVFDGGIEYPCWAIRNEMFLKQVLIGFLKLGYDDLPLYRLPPEWEQWFGTPSERSPLIHLTGPSYDSATGRWSRGQNNVDDLFYASMFSLAAFYIHQIKLPESADWIDVL
jgi:hypothetical protein